MSWDNGLHCRRIKSRKGVPYYEDIVDPDPMGGDRHRIIGIQNEQDFGGGFPGRDPGLSYTPGGIGDTHVPCTIGWTGNTVDGYEVELKTDQHIYHEKKKKGPTRNMFTWFALLNKNEDLMPHPRLAHMSFDVWYKEWHTDGSAGRSAGRLIAGMDVVFKGIWYEIEVNAFMDTWKNADKAVVKYEPNLNDGKKHFINLNGKFFDVYLDGLEEYPNLYVDWEAVLNWLIDNPEKYLPPEIRDSEDVMTSFMVGMENMSCSPGGEGSGVTHMKIKNWKIDAKE